MQFDLSGEFDRLSEKTAYRFGAIFLWSLALGAVFFRVRQSFSASAALFALSLVFAPVFLAIPGFATAPALIVVGYMMLSSCADINWQDTGEALPALIAVAAMPFTYSISDGLMLGVIAYTAINALSGNFTRIHWIMYILTALFIAKYALM